MFKVDTRPRHRNSGKAKEGREFPSHTAWVRKRPCILHGRHTCSGRMEAHHVKETGNGGMGLKPADFWVIPVCSLAHQMIHNGPVSFQRKWGIDLADAAWQFNRQSPHRHLWENDR